MADEDNTELCRQVMVVAIEHIRSIPSLFTLRRVSKTMKAICDDRLKRIKSATDVSPMWPFSLSLYQFVVESRYRSCPEMVICWHYFDPEYVTEDVRKKTSCSRNGYPLGTIASCKIPTLIQIAKSVDKLQTAALWERRISRLTHGRGAGVLEMDGEPDALEAMEDEEQTESLYY